MSRNNDDRTGAAPAPDAIPPSVVTPTANESVFTFTTPTEFVELPSGGRFYEEGHPLHAQETIEIKFMTAKEEDILTSPALLKKGIAIQRLLENVVIDKSIDIDSLLIGDKNALLIATRVTGYGNEYVTGVTCPSCLDSSRHEFDLGELVAQPGGITPENSENVTAGPEGTFFITGLQRTQAKVEVRLLVGTDEKAIVSRAARKKKHKLKSSPLLDQMTSFIVSVNDNRDPMYITSFLENLPASDSRYLRNTYTTLIPNIDMSQVFECENCAASTEMEVPLTAEFFWPRH